MHIYVYTLCVYIYISIETHGVLIIFKTLMVTVVYLIVLYPHGGLYDSMQ